MKIHSALTASKSRMLPSPSWKLGKINFLGVCKYLFIVVFIFGTEHKSFINNDKTKSKIKIKK